MEWRMKKCSEFFHEPPADERIGRVITIAGKRIFMQHRTTIDSIAIVVIEE
jgi:hypothetical protein